MVMKIKWQCIEALGLGSYIYSFPDTSVGKESDCNAGDSGSILGSGRSTGEGTVYPLQYYWAFLVAQLVMNLPAKPETWIQSLSWEDPLKMKHQEHCPPRSSQLAIGFA